MIETSYFWTNIFMLAAGTLLIRGSFIAISSRVQINPRWREIFSFIPAAILPAFIAPAVFFHQGHIEILANKERFFVLLLSTAVCSFSRSTFATIAFGLTLLFVLNF